MAANQKETVDKASEVKPIDVPKLDAGKTYTVVGTGVKLAEGSEHVVGGSDAMVLIKAGRATLKK